MINKDPPIPKIAIETWLKTEWLGFNIGVVALITAVKAVMTIIPIKYQNNDNDPINIVKKIHNNIYQAIDSESIIYPLKTPKCSVSKPETISLPLVIENGELGDLDIISTKSINAANGIENIKDPLVDW